MNKIRKLTILASLVLLFSLITTTVFGWFYFPNAKGLEMDTTPALDIDVKLHRYNGTSFVLVEPSSYRKAKSTDFINNDFIPGTTYYSIVETKSVSYSSSANYYVKSVDCYTLLGTITEDTYDTYSDLYTLASTEATTYNSQNTYYLASYAIEEKYEFFQWGDEYICEDSDPTHYYALECVLNSEAYTDGYVKSVLNMTLDCLGAFTYNTNQTQNASIPVFEASYAIADECAINISSSISTAKNLTYESIINGKYYTKSGDEYTPVNSYSDGNTYYTLDSALYYASETSFSSLLSELGVSSLYYFDNGVYRKSSSYVNNCDKYYIFSNIKEQTNVNAFSLNSNTFTTLDNISGVNSYSISNTLETTLKDLSSSTSYVHANDETHSTSYVRFIIYFKIEPDEDYITQYMAQNSGITDYADGSEIIVSNSLTFDLTMRSIPKYTEYPAN